MKLEHLPEKRRGSRHFVRNYAHTQQQAIRSQELNNSPSRLSDDALARIISEAAAKRRSHLKRKKRVNNTFFLFAKNRDYRAINSVGERA